MKVIEFFSGTASFSKVARNRGHETFTIDNDIQHKPDLCIDLFDFKIEMLPEEFRHPDFIWASPPCQKFSVASIYRYWTDGKPKTEETVKAIELVRFTIELINKLNPRYYLIENPRGMLRKQEIMQHLHRDTVAYCQYGAKVQKPTDLWNNLNYKFKPMCKPGSSCHERASRSSKNGVQGINNSFNNLGSKGRIARAIVPEKLCIDILKHLEELEQKRDRIPWQ